MSVAVYERDVSLTGRLEGYHIHINPAGSRALKACLPPPVWESFVATAGEPGGLGFLTEQLSELVVINGEATADPAEGSHAVDRITLRHLLLSGLDDAVHCDKTFTHYEEHDGKVTAFFDDGSCALRRPARRCGRCRIRRAPAWVPHRLATSMNMIVAPDPFFLFTSVFERRSGYRDQDDLDVNTGRRW